VGAWEKRGWEGYGRREGKGGSLRRQEAGEMQNAIVFFFVIYQCVRILSKNKNPAEWNVKGSNGLALAITQSVFITPGAMSVENNTRHNHDELNIYIPISLEMILKNHSSWLLTKSRFTRKNLVILHFRAKN
jgi:hypothetical protein